ncbi:hypothetical protein EDD86DRAFT_247533 [Gorgonomyces haynaldii]|nr:hypothetical protein EDD86DRAFT_247533 [Gorgonomyces haynaldii]
MKQVKVKCDMARPVCYSCLKSKRVCIFPLDEEELLMKRVNYLQLESPRVEIDHLLRESVDVCEEMFMSPLLEQVALQSFHQLHCWTPRPVIDYLSLAIQPQTQFRITSTFFYRHLVKSVLLSLNAMKSVEDTDTLHKLTWIVMQNDVLMSLVLKKEPLLYTMDVPFLDTTYKPFTKFMATLSDQAYVNIPECSYPQSFQLLVTLAYKIICLQRHQCLESPKYHYEEQCISYSLCDWQAIFASFAFTTLEGKAWLGLTEIFFWNCKLMLEMPKVTRDTHIYDFGFRNTPPIQNAIHCASTMCCALRVLTLQTKIHFSHLPVFAIYCFVNCGLALSQILVAHHDLEVIQCCGNNLTFLLRFLHPLCSKWQLFSMMLQVLLDKIKELRIDLNLFDDPFTTPYTPLITLTLY